MSKILFAIAIICLVGNFSKDIKLNNEKVDLKNAKKSESICIKQTKLKNKNNVNEDEEEPIVPDEPIDISSGSGLDNDKYLELELQSDGSYDLPEDADYSGEKGEQLLRYVKPGDIMYDSVGLGPAGQLRKPCWQWQPDLRRHRQQRGQRRQRASASQAGCVRRGWPCRVPADLRSSIRRIRQNLRWSARSCP